MPPLHTIDSWRMEDEILCHQVPDPEPQKRSRRKWNHNRWKMPANPSTRTNTSDAYAHYRSNQQTKLQTSYMSWGNGHWGWQRKKHKGGKKKPGTKHKGGREAGQVHRVAKFGFKRNKNRDMKCRMVAKSLTVLALNIDGLREPGRTLALAAYARQVRADILVISETHLTST